MFKCEFCNKQTESGEAMTRVPVEFRKREYVNRRQDGSFVSTTKGIEIVKEKRACESCGPAATVGSAVLRKGTETTTPPPSLKIFPE